MSAAGEVRIGEVLRAWWPLAASWVLMGAELPMLSAVVARLEAPEIHLAAYGGVVFPIALIVEAPIIMMLTASTALAKDRASYRALGRVMHGLSAAMTAVHALVAFTPLYDLIIVELLEVPAAVVEPGRLGLAVMLPWTWAIASRRFNQGVLIRGGRQRLIGVGTALRLTVGAVTLAIGYSAGAPGIVVATTTVIAGVTAEWLFAQVTVRPTLRAMDEGDPAGVLRGRAFVRFYLPLAFAPLITLIVQPIGAAAISRMPEALASLAVWPVVSGLLFLLQGAGLALNEVVVAMVERPGAAAALRRFAWLLGGVMAAVVGALVATPLAGLWFGGVSGLRPELAAMAVVGLGLGLPIAATRAIESWYQGVLVHGRQTGAITESVAVFLVVCTGVMLAGVDVGGWPGLWVAIAGFSVGRVAETGWVWWRSRGLRRGIEGGVRLG